MSNCVKINRLQFSFLVTKPFETKSQIFRFPEKPDNSRGRRETQCDKKSMTTKIFDFFGYLPKR